MAQTNYPYLDLTVLPDIRPHVISSRAVLLFDEAFNNVLWANGEGASLLGSPVLRDLMDGDMSLNPAMQRQIAAAIEQLDHEKEVSAVIRIRRFLRSRVLGFSVRKLELPAGGSAVLMITESLQGRGHGKTEMARTAVNCLDGYSHASAILGADGQIIAASEHFDALDVASDELTNLAREVETEADRLVKRLISTTNGPLAAGIARLSDNPASHILIIADAGQAEASQEPDQLKPAVSDSDGQSAPDEAPLATPEEPDANEVAAGPVVGAFSNRRNAGRQLGRWYYKNPDVASDDPVETPSDEVDAEPELSTSGQPDKSLEENSTVEPVIAADHTADHADGPAADHADDQAEEPAEDEVANSEVANTEDVQPTPSGLIQETSFTTVSQPLIEDDSDPAASNASLQSVDQLDDEFEFTVGPKPVRFVWDLDANNQFRSVSGEFAQAVGPNSADVVGLNWLDVTKLHQIDNGDEISALLNKGDTWSGKTVLWPVEGTDLRVPIDLAGLPSYGRNRVFEGFNGFGIVRSADAVVDPNATGLSIPHRGPDADHQAVPHHDDTSGDSGGDDSGDIDGGDGGSGRNDSAVGTETHNAGGLEDTNNDDIGTGEEKITSSQTPDEDSGSDKIVDLSSRRDPATSAPPPPPAPAVTTERTLSTDEQETFEEIGEKLADETDTASKDSTDQTDGPQSDPTDNGTREFTPSAFSGPSRPTAKAEDVAGTPSTADVAGAPNTVGVPASDVRIPDHNVDTSILARLPIPVLVYRENDLLFGNEQFFENTGYAGLPELAAAGGIDALFGNNTAVEGETQSTIFHANGQQLDVEANLQRVPWDDQRAMLLTLRHDQSDNNDNGPDALPDHIGHNSSGEPDGTVPEQTDGTVNVDGNGTVDGNAEGDRPAESTAQLAQVVPLHSTEKDPQVPLKPAFGGLGAEDLRDILDTATDGVVILTDEGIVRALNKSAEALFDVEPDAILDQSFTKILAPESHRSALDYLSGMSGTGVASLMNDGREVIGKTAKGGLIPLFMTIGKLQQTDACCAVMRDITQWKKAEEELLSAKSIAESASAQKTEFLAKVSHEIRTPLNAIIGFSDMMIEERFGKIDNDRYRGYLRDIHRSGNHVLELVNDLLDISKIEAGKMELEFDACDLNTSVSETVALTQPDANKERIIIRTSLSAVVPKVVADPRSLRQIVLNLVSNSIKFTKPGGQVIVSTVYEESGEVVLRVRDTGIGMSELELARALKPFQQINAETNSHGTGLGLPLTKAMVEANRARFEIESKPEEGTLVEIYFPSQRVLADR